MSQKNSLEEQWTAVDKYITDLLVPSDSALDTALEDSHNAGLPPHNVAPNQGKMLMILSQIKGAKKILEIGALGGYSTIWLARSLPSDGHLITLEADEKHAKVALKNINRAGLDKIVDLRLGKALDTLPQIDAEGCGPFDVVFIDADKQNNSEYFKWSLKMSRRGSLIIVDNVIRNGSVIDGDSNDPSVQGVRRLNELIASESRVSATSIQTVGSKGYDGFTLAYVISD